MAGRGLHHVTLVSGDAARSCAFYASVLGLRLVKRTVSHEDPGTYHLMFADGMGRPGTLLTLFPWQKVARGVRGACEAWRIALRVPCGSLGWWARRLDGLAIPACLARSRFGEAELSFEDPDGALLSLVEDGPAPEQPTPIAGSVPACHGVAGLHDVAFHVRESDPIGELFAEIFGFDRRERVGEATRLTAHDGPGGRITLIEAGSVPRGRLGAGSVHHAAFRARDAADADAMAQAMAERYGIRPTAPKDRIYFRSVHFRSTCGVLLEIATDEPGLACDEDIRQLGSALMLPPSLRERRKEIEALLPPIHVESTVVGS